MTAWEGAVSAACLTQAAESFIYSWLGLLPPEGLSFLGTKELPRETSLFGLGLVIEFLFVELLLSALLLPPRPERLVMGAPM